MDHHFRGQRSGLIEIGHVTERRSREEFKVITDKFAAEAIFAVVPDTLLLELAGWARSYYTLDAHVKAIKLYQHPKLPEPTDDAWNQTKQYVLSKFRRLPKISPISYLAFDDVKWIRSSAAGYGYQGHKGDNDNYKQAKRTAVTIALKLDHNREYGPQALLESTPDIAFTRTQLCQIKVKTKVRNVWGEAFHYVLLEGLFADPLIELFKREDTFYFIGRNPLLSVPTLITEMLTAKDYVYMFDWSSFDATVQEWELRFAFLCLESLFNFPSNVEFQIWRFITELFIYRKIAGPDQVLYVKAHGIPSGSCFTNIVGSITNFVRIQYMFKSLTGDFVMAMTHGDDSLAAVDSSQYVPMDRFSEVCAPLNWSINLSKSAVSNEKESISFLSRTVREEQNARDELVCLRMLMFPEYEVATGDVSALRAFSICSDAGVNSRYLYRIYQYLRDKYGVAESLPLNLRVWDPIEYEARRISVSESM